MEDLNQLCRLCAKEMGVKGYPIFESDSSEKDVQKKIDSLLPVKISMLDLLPKLICESCNEKLDQLRDFQSQCVQAEKNLTEILCTKIKDGQNLLKCLSMDLLQDNIIQTNDVFIQQSEPLAIKDNTIPDLETIDVLSDNPENLENLSILPLDADSISEIANDEFIQKVPDDMAFQPSDEILFEDNLNLTYSDVIEAVDSERTLTEMKNVDLSFGEEFSGVTYVTYANSDSLSDPISLDGGSSSSQTAASFADSIMLHYSKVDKDLIFNTACQFESSDSDKFCCPLCSATYGELFEFSAHYDGHFCVCTNCDLFFTSIESLQIHSRNCIPQNRSSNPLLSPSIPCKFCSKIFKTQRGLDQHCDKFHKTPKDEVVLKCDICDLTFADKQNLAMHLRHQHSSNEQPVKPFLCEICGKGFTQKISVRRHKLTVHSEEKQQYTCRFCGKRFVNEIYHRNHESAHKGNKPFSCEYCDRTFVMKHDLKMHKAMHLQLKRFACEFCHKTFTQRTALTCHRRVHTGERPYACDVCGRTFTQRTPMVEHKKRLHMEGKPSCDGCLKSFHKATDMLNHRKKCQKVMSKNRTYEIENHPPTTDDSNQQQIAKLKIKIRRAQ